MLHHGLNSRPFVVKYLQRISTTPKSVRCESTYSAIHRGLRHSEGSDRHSRGRSTEFSERRPGNNRREGFAPRKFDSDRSDRRPREGGERSRPVRFNTSGWGSEEFNGHGGDKSFGGRSSDSRPAKASRKSERRPWDARGPQKPLGQEWDNATGADEFDFEEKSAQSSNSSRREYASELRTTYENHANRRRSQVDANESDRGPSRLRPRRSSDEPSRDYRERRRSEETTINSRDRSSPYSPGVSKHESSNRTGKRFQHDPAIRDREPDDSKLISHYTAEKNVHTLPAWVRIPYTTAASQFIYGHSAIQAALRARRRKLYKLYIYDRAAGSDNEDSGGSERLQALRKRALVCGVNVKEVDSRFIPMMDRLSEGRPHNGCILEASPLPNPLIEGLRKVDAQDDSFEVIPSANQSAEELEINGTMTKYPFSNGGWRYPFLLYLDGITDTGNMGAILRSAYILGVDGIVMEPRNNASLNSTALKTSSGAAEAIQIFKIPSGSSRMDFFKTSREHGWRVYAAHMPPEPSTPGSPSIVYSKSKAASRYTKPTGPDHSPLCDAPAILILGNEETGVTRELLRLADYHVGVGLGRAGTDIGLDSLNVSVAASLLSMNFLQKPNNLYRRSPEGQKADADQDPDLDNGQNNEQEADRLF